MGTNCTQIQPMLPTAFTSEISFNPANRNS